MRDCLVYRKSETGLVAQLFPPVNVVDEREKEKTR